MKAREIKICGFWVHPDYPRVCEGGNVWVYQTQYTPTYKEFMELLNSGKLEDYQIILLDKSAEKKQALDTDTTYYKDLEINDLNNE